MQTFLADPQLKYDNFFTINVCTPELAVKNPEYSQVCYKIGLGSRDSSPGLHNGPWLNGYKFRVHSYALY